MFKTAENTDLNQISLTGIRALMLIGLLITKPHTLDEIKKKFIDLRVMEPSHSDDILRIDLNTVKEMGCKISRPTRGNGYKYTMSEHPFSFRISESELKVLKRVYNYVKKDADLITLIKYDELFKKIAFFICDEQSKELFLGISALRHYNMHLLENLIIDAKYQKELELFYKKSGSSISSRKFIIANNIVFKNDKIYLYGYDLVKKAPTVLNIKRIEKILTRRISNHNIKLQKFQIKFLLKNISPDQLEPEEEVIEKDLNGSVVLGSYHNEFLATQRILSFGADAIVLEPEDFKKNVIKKIKEMRSRYGD